MTCHSVDNVWRNETQLPSYLGLGIGILDLGKLAGHVLAKIAFVSCMLIAAACDSDAEDPILVFAAASLTDPVSELARRFEEDTGIRADLNFGGSNALARQIVAGAPADLFLSAGEAPVDLLVEEGLVVEPDVQELLGNELVVVTRSEGGQPGSFEALLSDRYARVTIVDPGLGPAGRYAEQALQSAGTWEALLPKVVLASDVRAVLSYVESGNADAGIVYRTDAATRSGLSVAFAVPSELHSPIRYLGAVPERSDGSKAAARLLEFLTSDDAADEFRRYGFLVAPSKVR